MFAFAMVQWWYGRGWAGVLSGNRRRLEHLAGMFSVAILLRTLFAPWRRIITYPGAGLGDHLRAIGDNSVSRVIGFFVRITVLIAAGILLIGLVLLGIIEFFLWPLIPAAGIGLLVWGLF